MSHYIHVDVLKFLSFKLHVPWYLLRLPSMFRHWLSCISYLSRSLADVSGFICVLELGLCGYYNHGGVLKYDHNNI